MSKKLITKFHRSVLFPLVGFPVMLMSLQLQAADVIVNIDNIRNKGGTVGCALFDTNAGFPGDISGAVETIYLPADPKKELNCTFRNLKTGRYAVSVTHDSNGNGEADKNFIGAPKEPWGVSNNIRKTMRAPKFDEAAFIVDSDSSEVTITIEVR